MKGNDSYELFQVKDHYIHDVSLSYSHLKNLYINGYINADFQYSTIENVIFYSICFGSNCFEFSKLKDVTIVDARGKLKSLGKSVNVRIKKYYDVYIHDIEYLMKKGVEKFIKKYGLVYIPYSLVKRNRHGEPMYELNNIINFIRLFGDLHKKDEDFYSIDLRNVLLFQDKQVEHIFFRAIIENKHIKDILKNEKISYKWNKNYKD